MEYSDFEWEEEEETDPMIGDGGDGGGIVLGDVNWGEHAVSLAREVLRSFGDDMALYAFKISPKGYIYLRLDKLTNKFGCPAIDEIDKFSDLYKKRLDEAGLAGQLPLDLALEVSSPGAERLLRVPQDLDRFRGMPMEVHYIEENQETKKQQQAEKVLMLESIDAEAEICVFKLANAKENRGEVEKGRTMSRKQRDRRLKLPFKSISKIKLYVRF
ncbi:hypothetical protein AXF42_Ash007545 [Apostasia shenzhenica]|uniref:DUF7912 domain-containing protein n=1 Tax=Apostasia shenzhenica TaxID=1088818 RepID=A0A2I0A5S3_9ASPA|nr:hypothetical protein AXF42_Ash007545 [Apostasia shenzhenica]